MKRIFLLFAFCSLLLTMFSCRSYKELILFRDAQPDSLINVLSIPETDYRIQPGDFLYISIQTLNEEVNRIFNPEERSGLQDRNTQMISSDVGAYLNGYAVDTAGMLNLPYMGKIPVAGFTQSEIEGIVQQRADEFLKDAIVKVRLLSYKVIMLGEVGSPGVYYYYGNNLTLLEALAMAGGHSDVSNIERIMVVRHTDQGNKTFMLDLSSIQAYSSEAFYLKPDDYVYVEPAKIKSIQLTAPAYGFFFGIVGFALSIIGLIW